MSQNITLLGASYSAVPAITLPKTGGGTARFTDVTDTTATASDVAQGLYFYTSAGVRTAGTASGGGGDSYTLTTVVPQQTVTVSSSTYTADNITMNSTLVVGDYYIVTLDGTEYLSTCGANWDGETYVGDSALLWYDGSSSGSNYTCPFAFERIAWNTGGSLHATSGSHTVKVEHLEFIDGPLNLISKSITSNGTYAASSDNADGYSSVTVNVSGGGGGNYQAKTNISPTTSSQTITPDSGYDALSSVQINAMPSGTAGTPTATKGSVSNHSVSVTPSVTNSTGYITGGTKSGTAVTVSASELVSGNKAITQNGNNIDVTDYATVSVNVSGGTSKNVQVAQSTTRVANTAYTKTASLTCAVSGTYDVYWDCFRSTTSGTSGSQLYIGGSASGSANTTFSNHAQNNHLTNVQINANQEVAVYVRSRATNYYAYCGQLTIVQTA